MPLVEVHHLSYRYPQGQTALDDVSFTIELGECVGLVGPNGAGKSTLLWHLNGLQPGAGQGRAGERMPRAALNGAASRAAVSIDGFDVTTDNLAEVRRRVGLVFQDPDDQLFCPTVEEDVAFGPLNLGLAHDQVQRRVDESLAAVGMTGFEQRTPHQLSIGERKRVCLAGVLACQPELIAFDEPTANLDPRGRRELIQLMLKLTCARLIASHDLEMIVETCSRVVVLDQGRIQAIGPTHEILANDALLSAHGLERPWNLPRS
ncbi:MAG: ABC transporter ATP-binding protein [Planctomycetaceae bacterium]|nr:ABC transporter ATP-binding protein [Planctomycetaceae bacterium]